MKKIVLIFLPIIFPLVILSQPCLPDGITLTTQAQIDSFPINYPGCTVIEGDVWIYGDSITNLHSLNVLTNIEGDLMIGVTFSENPLLVSLSGLNNLITIGGELSIKNNNSLESIIDLENLSSIGGDITIFLNPSLTSLTGLEGLNLIEGDLWITNNDSLSICEVQSICDYLVSPNGSVNIFQNATGCENPPEIANACGFTIPCLPFGNYYFTQQDEVDNFQTNYPGCNNLNGKVTVGRSYITNLNGLNMITTIAGNLFIAGNDSLINLLGLDNLTSIEGSLIIGTAYQRIVPGNYYCMGNPMLSNLTGLNNLAAVEGNVKIYCNYSLADLSGLDNLSYIGGSLIIGDEESGYGNELLTLTGLGSLSTLNGSLEIYHNELLSNLTGLNNFSSINGNLIIHGNNHLSTCEVQSICNYLSAPNGEVLIGFNAPGCNSPDEVQDSCIVNGFSLEELYTIESYSVSPNPCADVVRLRYLIRDSGYLTCDLYSISGVKIKRLIDEVQISGEHEIEIDVSDLPAGMYYFRIQAGDKIGVGKMVKMR